MFQSLLNSIVNKVILSRKGKSSSYNVNTAKRKRSENDDVDAEQVIYVDIDDDVNVIGENGVQNLYQYVKQEQAHIQNLEHDTGNKHHHEDDGIGLSTLLLRSSNSNTIKNDTSSIELENNDGNNSLVVENLNGNANKPKHKHQRVLKQRISGDGRVTKRVLESISRSDILVLSRSGSDSEADDKVSSPPLNMPFQGLNRKRKRNRNGNFNSRPVSSYEQFRRFQSANFMASNRPQRPQLSLEDYSKLVRNSSGFANSYGSELNSVYGRNNKNNYGLNDRAMRKPISNEKQTEASRLGLNLLRQSSIEYQKRYKIETATTKPNESEKQPSLRPWEQVIKRTIDSFDVTLEKTRDIHEHEKPGESEEGDYHLGPSGERLSLRDLKIIRNAWEESLDENDIVCSEFNLAITRRHVRCLEDGEWLNDEVINFFLQKMMQRKTNSSIYIWNTHFYAKLMEGDKYGYSRVKRWTKRKKVDVFSLDKILVPVNVGGVHWTLAVVNLRDQRFEYYDSLGHDGTAVLQNLEQWLRDESVNNKKKEFETFDWEFIIAKDIPHQENSCDCGMFMCYFADAVGFDKPFKFSQRHISYLRRRLVVDICSS